ncbi:glycosyltransferase family 2 protein [Pedobacter sp. BMA]|uniref:glycosyltransferase family 2 protein n=1 Tax=Pedobacter sp. BMA TaxID=1663685 RepID=UPI00064A7FC7|nr:glycosyltransferase family 2 protein [Pedobacter sp. BMA]KLT64021.1 hypothetical protein AB669_18315 [Pedobacter sp. BMA]
MPNTLRKITIAIPVYERYEYFEDAIYSAINQTVSANILVVDNNSSHARFKDFVDSLKNPQVSYIRNSENVGMVENWNVCIDKTETEWVTILHSDDMLSPVYIANMLAYIEKFPYLISVASDTHFGTAVRPDFNDPKKNIVFPFNRIKPNHFLLGNPIPFPGVLFNKRKINTKFKKDMYPIADYSFWYELSLISPLHFVNKKLAFYRISPQQETSEVYLEIVEKAYRFKNTITARNLLEIFLSKLDTYVGFKNYSKTHNGEDNLLNDSKYSCRHLIESYSKIPIPLFMQRIFVRIAKRIYISLT